MEKTLCRLCGVDISETSILLYEKDNPSCINDKIKRFLNIEVSVVNEPTEWLKICVECEKRLINWEKYVTHVLQVNSFFLKRLNSHNKIPYSLSSSSPRNKRPRKRKHPLKVYNKPEDDHSVEEDLFQFLLQRSIAVGISSEEISSTHPSNTDQFDLVKDVNEESVKNAADDGNSFDKETSDLDIGSGKTEIDDSITEDDGRSDTTQRKKKGLIDFGMNSWECSKCGEVQDSFTSLVKHSRDKHDAIPSVECQCGKILHSRTTVVKHRLKHTGRLQFKCDYNNCMKRFHRQSLLNDHLASHLPKDEQPWLCCKCSRRFHSKSLLKHHERLHLPNGAKLSFQCNICKKSLCSRSAVRSHVKAVHLGERPFVCDQCGLKFTSKGILSDHLKIHSDVCNYHCGDCNKSFKTKYRLKMHQETHEARRFTCHLCSQTLSTRRTLRMHLLVHEDRRKYTCDACGKSFKRSKDLKNHLNLHTGKKPYSCPFCTRTFANGSNCRSHKRRMHPTELELFEAKQAGLENFEDGLDIVHNGKFMINKMPVVLHVEDDTSHGPLGIQSNDPMLNDINVCHDVGVDDVVIKDDGVEDLTIMASDDVSSTLSLQFSSYSFPTGLNSL